MMKRSRNACSGLAPVPKTAARCHGVFLVLLAARHEYEEMSGRIERKLRPRCCVTFERRPNGCEKAALGALVGYVWS